MVFLFGLPLPADLISFDKQKTNYDSSISHAIGRIWVLAWVGNLQALTQLIVNQSLALGPSDLNRCEPLHRHRIWLEVPTNLTWTNQPKTNEFNAESAADEQVRIR